MLLDLLLVIIMLAWSIQKIIDKKLLASFDSFEYTKWSNLVHFILVIPFIFLLKDISFSSLLIIFIVSAFGIVTDLLVFKATKKDEVSRVTPVMQFSAVFAVLFSLLFLGEKATLIQIIGVFLMIAAGFMLAAEKPLSTLKAFFHSNLALIVISIAASISGISMTVDKSLLFGISAITLLFYKRLSAAILISPTIRKKISFNPKQWLLFITSRALSTYGLLLFLWILSKQELIFTVPILAVQPLIVFLLGSKILGESKKTFYIRLFAIVVLIAGYLLLKL